MTYLNSQLRDGDKIFVKSIAYIPGILHYFGVKSNSRHYNVPIFWNSALGAAEVRIPLICDNRAFTIYHSDNCCAQYISDGGRLWILVGTPAVKDFKDNQSCVLKGYFDGSFANFRRFPSDASMYLFLWNPSFLGKKGIDMPIE